MEGGLDLCEERRKCRRRMEEKLKCEWSSGRCEE